jgi:hypothetical protein
MQDLSLICMCHVCTKLFATKLIHHSRLEIEKLLRNLPTYLLTYLPTIFPPPALSRVALALLSSDKVLNADLLPLSPHSFQYRFFAKL